LPELRIGIKNNMLNYEQMVRKVSPNIKIWHGKFGNYLGNPFTRISFSDADFELKLTDFDWEMAWRYCLYRMEKELSDG
jgi:hypothetical protein